ncbi:MAG: dihydropyrimidinase [Chloroflexota bacterium]
MRTLIKGGTVVTAADTYPADILVEGEKIALMGVNLPAEGVKVIDATGKLILPGGIDVHTHLELPFFSTVSSDDFYTGHKAAAFGGTTSHIDFAIQRKGESLRQALDNWRAKAQGKAVLDYGLHIVITDPTEAALAEIPWLVGEGVTTLKLFTAYKGVYQIDDGSLFRIMRIAAEHGLLVMVHAENGDVLDTLIKENVAKGNLATEYHAHSHPAWAEAEATLRMVALAGLAGASLYVVHITCEEAVDQLKYGRAHGLSVMGETCPQYLFFTVDELRRPDGAKWVCSPPVRSHKDNESLWRALAKGDLQVVATDHCPFLYDGTRPVEYEGELYQRPGKELGQGDFSQIPNGMHGIEERMLLLWTYGVAAGRLSANRFVELTATNPAKIFGLYPRKGVVAVGADADLLLWDPQAQKTMGVRTAHGRLDHNVYEGWSLTGRPEKVFVRGHLLVDGETWYGEPGGGNYLHRQAYAPFV